MKQSLINGSQFGRRRENFTTYDYSDNIVVCLVVGRAEQVLIEGIFESLLDCFDGQPRRSLSE